MIDFLRVISPYLYTVVPAVLIIWIAFNFAIKNATAEQQILFKKIRKGIIYVIFIGLFVVIAKMAMINEVLRNELDNSVKKERSNYAVEKAKQDTVTFEKAKQDTLNN